MLGSLINVWYVLSGCQVLVLLFSSGALPSSVRKGHLSLTPALMKAEDRLSFSVWPGQRLAAHFSLLGLVSGLWEKVRAGGSVRANLSVENLRLSLCSGIIMIMHVKCGLRRTLCGWSCFDSLCPPPFPFPLMLKSVIYLTWAFLIITVNIQQNQ